ncbi:DUF7681 family protein [Candidatus Binatus sp.]|uniref:Acb2/Tad1 domain-containing protein n=1 Tax=Candidatus Binatus sp. TaxID=2811406 RepID=UPI003CC32F6B
MATFLDWMRRGKQATSGKFYDFFCAVNDAEAQAVLMATRTIRDAMIGGWFKVPKRDKDGNYIFKHDPVTGEILRDVQGRPEAELADEYREPSAAAACWFLERRAREDFGDGGNAGVTVNVNPPVARRNPGKKEMLSMYEQVVQILVDNGMKLPDSATREYLARNAKPAETPAFTLTGVESMSEKDLDDWFSHHAPHAGQQEKFDAIHAAGKDFARVIRDCTPPGAHQTAAVRKMREALYTASAAIEDEKSAPWANVQVEGL